MEENYNKTKWLHLRLSVEEHKKLNKQFKKTTCRKLSEYARKVLFSEPVIAATRNQSLDDVMTVMISLKKELNAAGNNFNQAVKKLHTLDNSAQVEQWAAIYDLTKNRVANSIENIQSVINKMSDQWLR